MFSKDLDGEFGNHATGFQDPHELASHSTCSFEDSSEVGFTLLSDASKRKLIKCLSHSLTNIAVASLRSQVSSDSIAEDESPVPRSLFILKSTSRPPPSVLL